MPARATPDGVLLLDKPPGITSTRALVMAKRALAALKAGHTGTLDPFATGLLPLVFGDATKFSRFMLDAPKAYLATLALGEESETGDPESAPRRVSDRIPELQEILDVLRVFTGDLYQVPPMHSAIHVDGRRLYEYAREGLEVPRDARQIHVSMLEVVQLHGPQLVLAVACSKGTYVRVLAADIGRALGCGAFLSALRRTRVGTFRVESALGLEELVALGTEGARARLLPAETLVSSLTPVQLDEGRATRFRQGQVVDAPEIAESTPVAVFGAGLGFMGVGEPKGGRVAPLRLVAERPKSPDFA